MLAPEEPFDPMYVGPMRFRPMVCLVVAVVGCGNSPSSGSAGGAGSGGTFASGGGAGGATGGQNSGGHASSGGSNGSGGSARGGTTGSGGSGSGGVVDTGGGLGGAASGGRASGGATGGGASGSAGGQSGGSGSGGLASGGATASGGLGAGGRNAGGATGSGGGGAGGAGMGQGGQGQGGSSVGGTTGAGGSTGYRPCPTDGTPCKIMPFGDSITDGYNADTPGGYRVELFRRAHAAGKNITFVGSGQNGPATVDGVAFPRNHEGHSGWTIDPTPSRSGISTLLKNDGSSQSVMVKYTPHIVLLMIGTNDAIDNYDMANAPTRLGKLIDTIYGQLPDVLIVVAEPIPTRGDTSKGDDAGTSARIKTYNDAIPAVVKARADAGKHILVVDMYTPFTPKASLLEDQWHPNLQGYVVLGTQWYSALESVL
jgi:lysophospholipase L1-like esterase